MLSVQGWQIGLVITMALGVAVIMFGALWDRERHRARVRRLQRPPERAIPGYMGEDPTYVTPDTRIPPREPALSDADREDLRVRLIGLTPVEAGLAHPAFVNDAPSGWAVLDEAAVLVCAEPVETLHEVLPFLEYGTRTKTALVLVAPAYDPETLATLTINHAHRTVAIAAVTADRSNVRDIAETCGAIAIPRIDLQAGWIPDSALGRAHKWIGCEGYSFVIANQP